MSPNNIRPSHFLLFPKLPSSSSPELTWIIFFDLLPVVGDGLRVSEGVAWGFLELVGAGLTGERVDRRGRVSCGNSSSSEDDDKMSCMLEPSIGAVVRRGVLLRDLEGLSWTFFGLE